MDTTKRGAFIFYGRETVPCEALGGGGGRSRTESKSRILKKARVKEGVSDQRYNYEDKIFCTSSERKVERPPEVAASCRLSAFEKWRKNIHANRETGL